MSLGGPLRAAWGMRRPADVTFFVERVIVRPASGTVMMPMRTAHVLPPPSSWRRARHCAVAAWLALGSLAAVGPACLACDEIACGGGLEWTARTEGNAGLVPGAYELQITLEGSSYTVECTVADTWSDSDCGEPVQVGGAVDFDVRLDLQQVESEDWNPDGPAGGFYLDAADRSDSDDVASSTRGPTEVQIVVLHDGQPLLDESYELTYERNEDFRGNERCGYCDEREFVEATIVQP